MAETAQRRPVAVVPISDYRSRLLGLLASDADLAQYEGLLEQMRREHLPEAVEAPLVADLGVALRLREEFAHKRKRERELSALYETARDLSSLRDTDLVLKAIVRRARHLAGTDIAYISAADESRGDFYVRATEGVVSDDFAKIRVPRNVGICGRVAETRAPLYSSAYFRDGSFRHTGEIDEATHGEGIVSILGIPLEVDSTVIGVLFVGDRYERSYSPQEVAVLSSLATFAALAIENAKLLEEARRLLVKAEVVNEALEAKARAVEDAALAHEQLTELVARGGSLEDLAGRVTSFLGGSVCVLDDQRKVLCGTLPPAIASEDFVRAMWEGDRLGRSVQIPHGDGTFSRVAVIVGGSMRLGALVYHGTAALSPSEVRTFERSAIVTGIVLLSAEKLAQAAYQSIADVVTSLMRGQGDPFAPARSKLLPPNVVVRWPVTMMLIELGAESPSAAAAAIRGLAGRKDTIYAEFNGDLVLVTNVAQPEPFARQIADKLEQAFGNRSTIVISALVASSAEVTQRYQALRRCLRLVHGLGQGGRIAFESAFAPYALLFRDHDEDALRDFTLHMIGPIIDYDSRRKTRLAETLLAFLDHGHSQQKAAEVLNAHVNTIRQRLETISQLKPEWSDPGIALDVHIALRLNSLSGASPH